MAYLINSERKLYDFFEKWHKNIKPISDEDYASLNDTIKAIYDASSFLFSDTSNWYSVGNDKFALIQKNIDAVYVVDKVYYTENEIESFIDSAINALNISDSIKTVILSRGYKHNYRFSPYATRFGVDEKHNSKLQILNFKPKIINNELKPLYWSETQQRKLHNFLHKTIFNKKGSENNLLKKIRFLSRNKIHLFRSYNTHSPDCVSEPWIHNCYLSKSLNNIMLEISNGFNFGYIILEKKDNNWVVIYDKVELME
jgi:hypothetical protein